VKKIAADFAGAEAGQVGTSEGNGRSRSSAA